MTKRELVQKILDGLGAEFGHRTAERHISSVFNTVIGQLFTTNQNQYRYYTKRITLTVKNRVATVPIALIQNASNGHGIPAIMPTGAEDDCCPDDTEFYPAPSFSLHSGADANLMGWVVFYTVTQDKVRFNKSLPKEVTSLIAEVIPQFTAYEDSDIINLPSGVEQMIVDQSIAAMKADPAYINIYKKKT